MLRAQHLLRIPSRTSGRPREPQGALGSPGVPRGTLGSPGAAAPAGGFLNLSSTLAPLSLIHPDAASRGPWANPAHLHTYIHDGAPQGSQELLGLLWVRGCPGFPQGSPGSPREPWRALQSPGERHLFVLLSACWRDGHRSACLPGHQRMRLFAVSARVSRLQEIDSGEESTTPCENKAF